MRETVRIPSYMVDAVALRDGSTETPLISVIVATFNACTTLDRCLRSVSTQTYPHRELIVIDGGSSDGTVEILRRDNEQIRYWVSEPDRGIYHAWNKALAQVHGEWIYFLGADDYFSNPYVLARVTQYLSGNLIDARVVYGRVDLVRSDDSVIETLGEPWDRKRFFQLMTLPHQGVFHHRSLFEQGGFNEAFRIAGDYELLLRELKTRDPIFIGQETIAAMQFGGVSSNGRMAVESLLELKRARELHGIAMVSPIWRWVLIKAHVRRYVLLVFGEEWARVATNWYRRLTFRSSV